MIVAADHCVLVCLDLDSAIDDMTLLLGSPPVSTSESGEIRIAVFSVDNISLELIAPHGSGQHAERLRQIVEDSGGPVLASLVFASDQLHDDHRRFERRGLMPGDVTAGTSGEREHFRLADEVIGGIRTFVVAQPTAAPAVPSVSGDQVHSMDHLVVTTSSPERAVANYGGRLGLNLALDRTEEKWGVRFLFFRVGKLILEIVQNLNQPAEESDRLWGITWAVQDLNAARARLMDAGVAVSEIRTGRKPGSEVFTIKSHNLEIPTLFIAHQPRAS